MTRASRFAVEPRAVTRLYPDGETETEGLCSTCAHRNPPGSVNDAGGVVIAHSAISRSDLDCGPHEAICEGLGCSNLIAEELCPVCWEGGDAFPLDDYGRCQTCAETADYRPTRYNGEWVQ